MRDRPHDVPDQDKLLWWIPIVLISQDNMNFTNSTPTVWMKKEREIVMNNLPGPESFIIINPEEIGSHFINLLTRSLSLFHLCLAAQLFLNI